MKIAVRPKEKLDSAVSVNLMSFLLTCARCQVLLHTQVNLEDTFYRPPKYFNCANDLEEHTAEHLGQIVQV